MKKMIFIAVSLLAAAVTLWAGDGNDKVSTNRFQKTTGPFQHLVVNHDISIVLTYSANPSFEVVGEQKNTEGIQMYIKKGTLYIKSKNGSLRNKALVYLSVTDLRTLIVNGKSKIKSAGTLKSKRLVVQVNDEASFDLKNEGQILFEADDLIDLHFEHNNYRNSDNSLLPATDEFKEADRGIDSHFLKQTARQIQV